MFHVKLLLPDTEPRKNFRQYFLYTDATRNATQGIRRVPKILGNQLKRQMHFVADFAKPEQGIPSRASLSLAAQNQVSHPNEMFLSERADLINKHLYTAPRMSRYR
jgi:hypothetical protein